MCVCVFIHNERERGILGGNCGMSDGNDLIEEQIKMKMSDGMFQNKHPKCLSKHFSNGFPTAFSFSSFFSFHFVPHLHTSPRPPSAQNLLFLSHDVHPDDYGSDCVDDDCC